MIHSYVIGRGNTATAYLQAGVIRPAPGPIADAVVDVQVQRTGGESRLKDEEVVLFFLAEKRAERTCGEEKMATPGWTEKKRSSAPLRRGGVPQKIYWEGINLNKISKKIVSLVTVAAFATTLVPAAAFAASDVPVGPSTSSVADVTMADKIVILNNGTATADVDIDINENLSASSPYSELAFWFTDEKGAIQDMSKVGLALDSGSFDYSYDKSGNDVAAWNTSWWLADDSQAQNVGATATFKAEGTYTLYAANWTSSTQASLDYMMENKQAVEVGTVTVIDPADVPDADNSALLIDGNPSGDATQNAAEPIEFVVKDGGTGYPLDLNGTIYAWVEDSNGVIVKDAGIASEDATVTGPANGIYTLANVNNGDVLDVTFPDAGDGYTVNCVVVPTGGTVQAPEVVADNKVQIDAGSLELGVATVNVAPADPVTDDIDIVSVDGDTNIAPYAVTTDENGVKYISYNYEIDDNITPNDLKDYKVVGKALKDGEPVANETFKVVCQNGDLTLSTTEVTTNAKGEFEYTFSIDNTGDYTITISELKDKVVAILHVSQDAMAPVDIETVKDNGLMLAGTDDNYIYNQYNYLSEVQFNIIDAYDRDATGEKVIKKEAAANKGGNHDDFVDVVAPEGSDLKDAEINLAWDGSAYTLEYVGGNPTEDLIPGEYTVTVSLNNGKDATVHFTLAEFQGAESLDISMNATANGTTVDDAFNNNAITAVDDTVALGQHVHGDVYLVDAQGLKILAPASNLSVGVAGTAIATNSVVRNNPFGFDTVDNIPANQSVIGSVITVKAYDEYNKLYVEKELTVVSNYGDETLAFDPVQGPVGKNNAVEISVVDADGNLSKVNGEVTAYIASQSDETATIDLTTNENVKNGKGTIYLESDKAGAVDVVVAVKADNGEIYGATLTYTFGDEDPYAGSYIVMTIGSDQYLINGEMFDGSADNLGAPYIDSAWRTMVPVRVLAESFGADVEYADNVVTIVDGDTTVVMNIGEETYTVNGEEKAMDTAAVIGDDDRTYVPVRFVAEALGYSVTPLYDANGLTSSVHFSK